uniref:Uncharacterized protein n=1 Tax=Heterorhabditis bacteriophora TaxID=37862 RepID=A0A1I7X6N0_HETBA
MNGQKQSASALTNRAVPLQYHGRSQSQLTNNERRNAASRRPTEPNTRDQQREGIPPPTNRTVIHNNEIC